MSAVWQRIKREPVLLLDLLKAVLAVLLVFGVPLPPGVDIALAGLTIAVLSLFTRSRVEPSARSRRRNYDPDVP